MSSLRPRIDPTPRDQRHCRHRLAKGSGSTQHSCIVAKHCSNSNFLVQSQRAGKIDSERLPRKPLKSLISEIAADARAL
jgi:hypothetical protein